ncbi:RagB/SusD family nutrient uptake outer membrane protein [Danxiaibacter flavus]|uniref:RagB/SusD family nutrient uptake outer membrane protein n=1 Tax=Danxiaibacter flavus TaxID=3049108 RepID=A0ABV3ZAQ6_9BACT|nr:RagB/SusD family nutrient uptake outer membrane protein [Chitinophagaceae bacterium DXS]
MKRSLIILAAVILVLSGCSKTYLDRYPLDQQTEVTAFKTSDNFKTYAWGLYGTAFVGYGNDNGGADDPALLYGDRNSDNMGYGTADNSNAWALQTVVVPNSGGVPSTGVSWDFSYIRSVNLMLDNVDQSAMTQTDKDHWRSVGLLFRSVRYMQLLSGYGDVQWVEHVVKDSDKDILYGKRDPRDTVAARILRDLKWAESHIKPNGDGPNTINQNVVRAIISRFGLFEGTWRKYHGLQGAQTYLLASIDASAQLLAAFPAINPSYDLLFNSESLANVPGVILYKAYAVSQRTHGMTRYSRTSSWNYDLTRDAVESYLCSDGKPVKASADYSDSTMYSEFRKRDRRLYYTVIPPYRVVTANGNATWSHTGNVADREFIDTMNNIRGASSKALPVSNWSSLYVDAIPHFRGTGAAFVASRLGYYFWKFYNTTTPTDATNNTTDCPVLHIEETMLNYAEAMYEMGQFNQGVADQTINKLRARANVAPMQVADISASFDPARDASVNPVLWEIRRERRVELMGEGFRFDDLRRWNKCNYINQHSQLGVRVKRSDYPANVVKIYQNADQGYVQYFQDATTKTWPDYYYLHPLPLNDLTLNPNLVQNTGWK